MTDNTPLADNSPTTDSSPAIDSRPAADTEAQAMLADAQRLAHDAQRSSRWYAVYLLVYAVGTFAMSVLLGVLRGQEGALAGMTIWIVMLGALTVYQRRQRTLIKRFGLLHTLVITTWAGLWVITVMFGSLYFGDLVGWWIAGGIACAVPPLAGAVVVLRETR